MGYFLLYLFLAIKTNYLLSDNYKPQNVCKLHEKKVYFYSSFVNSNIMYKGTFLTSHLLQNYKLQNLNKSKLK